MSDRWQIELDSNSTRLPGDRISGTVIIPSSTTEVPPTIKVSLRGVERTVASYKKQSMDDNSRLYDSNLTDETREEQETQVILRIDVEATPADKEKRYRFPFSIDIPVRTVGSDTNQWRNISLPPSLTLPRSRGYVQYHIQVNQKKVLAGLIPMTSRIQHPVEIAALNETSGDPRIQYTQRGLNVLLYDASSLLWSRRLMHTVGFDVSSGAIKFYARMDLPAAGFVPGSSLQDKMTLSLTPQDPLDPGGTKFEVDSMELYLVTTCYITAMQVSDIVVKRWSLVKLTKALAFPLEFGDSGRESCNITALVSGALVPLQVPPSIIIPGIQVKHELVCVLSVQPRDDPRLVVPVYCTLPADVTVSVPTPSNPPPYHD